MSKPQNDLNNSRYLKETFIFFEKLAEICQDTEDCRTFLKEILTPSEIRMVKKRWYIARLLHSGMDVRSVAAEASVSTTTVVRVSQTLKKEGSLFKKILRSIEDQNGLAENQVAGKILPENNSTHRYAFGHDEETTTQSETVDQVDS